MTNGSHFFLFLHFTAAVHLHRPQHPPPYRVFHWVQLSFFFGGCCCFLFNWLNSFLLTKVKAFNCWLVFFRRTDFGIARSFPCLQQNTPFTHYSAQQAPCCSALSYLYEPLSFHIHHTPLARAVTLHHNHHPFLFFFFFPWHHPPQTPASWQLLWAG